MRILFLTHYFPPEVNAPANRTFEHCREWVRAGHHVEVITCVPSHPRGVPFDGFRSGWYSPEVIEGINVHRVWTYLAPNRGVLRRTANYLSFVPTAVWRMLRLGRFDVVIGTSPQFFCAVAAWIGASLKRTPWVFELRDLWPESIPAVGAMKRSAALSLLERLELRMYRSAAVVVCLTRAFIENLASRGVDRAKLAFIPNGVEPEMWVVADNESARRSRGLRAEDLVVSYVGTIGMAHGLGVTLDAARQLSSSNPNVRFLIVGDGAELDALNQRVKKEGLTNVALLGLVPRQQVPAILAASDIVLVTLKPSDVFKTVLPSKLFEAMAAARPVVLGVEGEARRVLEDAGAGIAVTPGDALSLGKAIRTLAASPALRDAMGLAGHSYVSQHFSRTAWAKTYLGLLRGVSGTSDDVVAVPARQPADVS